MSIKAKDITIIPISQIKPNPANRNRHSPEQIERLAKIIKYQGFRSPLIISNLSGLLVSGHGRLEAALQAGMTELPVTFQDFESSDQEYAAMVSDNSIANWAFLDLGSINTDIADLGPDFDLEHLGLKNFTLDFADKLEEINRGDENSEWVDMPEFKEGDGYIRLMLQFGCEDARLKYATENNLEIARKLKSVWVVNL